VAAFDRADDRPVVRELLENIKREHESCVICRTEASSHLDTEYRRASPPTQSKCLGAGLEALAKDNR
jgi:hypothetical protein